MVPIYSFLFKRITALFAIDGAIGKKSIEQLCNLFKTALCIQLNKNQDFCFFKLLCPHYR